MDFFFLHFVLKDRDILVRSSSLSVPEEQCKLCLTGSPPQKDKLKRSEPSTRPFF